MKRIRKSFGKIRKIVEIPDLIGMQRGSYHRFLQVAVPPEKREDIGLQSVFRSVFPIKDFSGSASLEFVSYKFGLVKHSVEECIHRGMTYEIPVKITVRLVVYDVDKETGISNIRDIKEQEIYFGSHSSDDGQRHVYHQRHGTGRGESASPLIRRVFQP